MFFGPCQYQNKKALFTDSIFQKVLRKREGKIAYSSVPNRRVGPINPVGWIFHGKLINV